MKEVRELWAAVVDRVKNPFLFAFSLAWIVSNYKLFVVVFGGGDFKSKIEFIDCALYPTGNIPYERILWVPLGFSVFYVLLLPGISLISTWAECTYERLHGDMRARSLRKTRLTTEQRDMLEEKTAEVVEKLKRELQEERTNRLQTMSKSSDNIRQLFQHLLRSELKQLALVAGSWKNDALRPSHDWQLHGTPEQDAFAAEYGIPKRWGDFFLKLDSGSRYSISEMAKLMERTQDETLEEVVGMCAVGLLNMQWIDDAPYFFLGGGSWGALLNGRPA